MNITPISFNFFQNSNVKQQNNVKNYSDSRLIKPNYRNTLSQDTVSFQAALQTKAISESVWNGYVKESPRLKRIATSYLDTIELVASKFKDYGVSFIREMFEPTAVKDANSKLSKVTRSKTFDVRDSIRTTLFVKNPYDLSILFDKIIPELGPESGRIYKVATIPVPVGDLMERGYVPIDEVSLIKDFFKIPHDKFSHGKYFRELRKAGYEYDATKNMLAEYLKKHPDAPEPPKDEIIELAKTLRKNMPDVDIRLDPKLIDRTTIPEEYKYCIGKPQGPYEDIQLRFYRTTDRANTPIYHELLIHFGPTYNRNAFKEHSLVYENLRLFKELNIPINDSVGKHIDFAKYPEQGVAQSMNDIKKMFRTKISHKLISNGKNADYYGNNEEEVIFFSLDDIERFEKKMGALKYHLKKYYEKEIAKAKASPSAVEQLQKDSKADVRLINKIWKQLEETIEAVNDEFDLKKV